MEEAIDPLIVNPIYLQGLQKTVKIVYISDTHSRIWNNIPEGDIIIHCGDWSNNGRENMIDKEVSKFILWFSSLPHKHKILVCGNHEIEFAEKLEYNRENIDNYLKSLLPENFDKSNFHYLQDSSIVVEGIHFYGTPHTHVGQAFSLPHEHIKKSPIWDMIPDGVHILISHSPPRGVLDRVHGLDEDCKRIQLLKPLEATNSSAKDLDCFENDFRLVSSSEIELDESIRKRFSFCNPCQEIHQNDFHWGNSHLLLRCLDVKPLVHVFGHVHQRGGCSEYRGGTCFINAALMDFHRPVVTVLLPKT